MESSRRYLGCILAFAFVLDGIVALSMSLTADEDRHIEYGTKILHGQPDRSGPFMDIKTPITVLNALPRVIGVHVPERSFPRIRKLSFSLVMARFSSVVAALAVIFFITGLLTICTITPRR
jgi:hypothetical protein